jgi:hypothetical protein
MLPPWNGGSKEIRGSGAAERVAASPHPLRRAARPLPRRDNQADDLGGKRMLQPRRDPPPRTKFRGNCGDWTPPRPRQGRWQTERRSQPDRNRGNTRPDRRTGWGRRLGWNCGGVFVRLVNHDGKCFTQCTSLRGISNSDAMSPSPHRMISLACGSGRGWSQTGWGCREKTIFWGAGLRVRCRRPASGTASTCAACPSRPARPEQRAKAWALCRQ